MSTNLQFQILGTVQKHIKGEKELYTLKRFSSKNIFSSAVISQSIMIIRKVLFIVVYIFKSKIKNT